jgi:heat shock protein HslJ
METRRMILAAGLVAGSGARAQQSAVTGIEWAAEEIAGQPVPPGVEVTLTLDGARAFGRSGCNRFTGEASLGSGTLRFGEVAGTRMACPPPAMAVEQAVHAAFERTRLFVIDGSRSKLRLMDEAGATLMVLSR